MNIDPGILCFTHCRASIFCKNLPERCPLCREKLSGSAILPFRIPYPFVRANQKPCSILIKPSTDTFFKYYSMDNNDLHIGITTTKGIVTEYDTNGITNKKTNSWNECLVVYELTKESWSRHWDALLSTITKEYSSSKSQYDENTFNCYSFVINFVQYLQLEEFKTSSTTKETFCQEWILPRLKEAWKYVSLFREIQINNVFIKNNI